MKRIWAEADSNFDNQLDIKEIEKLLKKLNYNFEKSYLKQLFKQFDVDKSGFIDFEEFDSIMNSLRSHGEVNELFIRYKNPKTGLIHAEDLLRFYIQEQGVANFTLKDATDLISQLIAIETSSEMLT